MDELLDKGNAGLLTGRELTELGELIEEFEERTLQKALAIDVLKNNFGDLIHSRFRAGFERKRSAA